MAKRINWDFIKHIHRTATLSNVEIAHQYNAAHNRDDQKFWKKTITEGAIRKKIGRDKKKGIEWERDLSVEVRKRARAKLVRKPKTSEADKTDKSDKTEEEAVEEVASSMADVMRSHRQDVARLTELEQDLMTRLLGDEIQVKVFAYQGDSFEHEVHLGLLERSQVYRNLVHAMGNRINLERRAWGIDDDSVDPNAPDKIEVIQEF